MLLNGLQVFRFSGLQMLQKRLFVQVILLLLRIQSSHENKKIATPFSLSRVEVRQDWRERNGRGRTGNLTSSAFRLLPNFPLDWLSSSASLVFLAHTPLPLDRISHIQNDYPGRARTWQLTRTGPEAST